MVDPIFLSLFILIGWHEIVEDGLVKDIRVLEL